jgi:hypothetical protein
VCAIFFVPGSGAIVLYTADSYHLTLLRIDIATDATLPYTLELRTVVQYTVEHAFPRRWEDIRSDGGR